MQMAQRTKANYRVTCYRRIETKPRTRTATLALLTSFFFQDRYRNDTVLLQAKTTTANNYRLCLCKIIRIQLPVTQPAPIGDDYGRVFVTARTE